MYIGELTSLAQAHSIDAALERRLVYGGRRKEMSFLSFFLSFASAACKLVEIPKTKVSNLDSW
jgi:hypothetical protein